MLSFEERQRFYEQSKIVLKDNPQWRLYKIQLEEGKWENLPNQMRNSEQLRKILIEKAPINVFSSCSTWLNPLKVEHPSYTYADALFIYNDIFVDIDKHDVETYNEVYCWFKKNPRYIFQRSVDSGEGLHQYYIDTWKPECPNPLKRFRQVEEEREILAENLSIFDVDVAVICDMHRISRVIGTLNDGEKPCTILYDPQLGICSERLNADEWKQPIAEYMGGARTGRSTLPKKFQYWYWNFIDTLVSGVEERHCIYIKKDKHFGLPRFDKLLKKIQKVYGVSSFHKYESYNTYEAICPDAVPLKRVVKILKMARSKNYAAMAKYGHNWIRVSKIKNECGEVIDSTPVKIGIIECVEKRYPLSRPHCNYLNINSEGDIIGEEKNKIRTTFMKVQTKYGIR